MRISGAAVKIINLLTATHSTGLGWGREKESMTWAFVVLGIQILGLANMEDGKKTWVFLQISVLSKLVHLLGKGEMGRALGMLKQSLQHPAQGLLLLRGERWSLLSDGKSRLVCKL